MRTPRAAAGAGSAGAAGGACAPQAPGGPNLRRERGAVITLGGMGVTHPLFTGCDWYVLWHQAIAEPAKRPRRRRRRGTMSSLV